MSSFKSVGYLTISNALNKAAQAIANEKGQAGRVDHEIPKNIYSKVQFNGSISGKIGELISLRSHSSE
jgi:uncharacterized protein YkwD